MSDDKTYSQADIDAAVAKALDGVKSKNDELLDEVKGLKAKLRATSEISPEEMARVEAERDKALAELGEAAKQVKALTAERDKAAKTLEAEQGAARTYALEAEIAGAIAAGNVVPALVPGLTAMVKQQAKADLVDGKYAVMIGDKPAKDYISGFLDSDDGKAYRAAMANGGGGANPGTGGTGGGKTVTRAQLDGMAHGDRSAFMKEGGKVVDAAA
jgi:hypothetical protein